MNTEAIEKINFKTHYSENQFIQGCRHRQDQLCIGTEYYQGLAYFHNYEYRHLLRSLGDYKNWTGEKLHISWNKAYKAIHDGFVKAGLETAGFSIEHTRIIAKVLRMKPNKLIKAYHD